MPSKRTEFGRSLVETLAVLVVIAILLLAGLAGYNFTIHKYKKDQTVKAISELAVRYKLHPISTTGAVNIKAVYPEAERADAVNMRTADTETGRVRLEVSEDNSYFAVVVNSILDDSCAEYLEKGEYDAALLLKGETYNSKSDKEYLAFGKDFLKDFDLNKLTTEQKDKLGALTNGNTSKEAVINVICAGAPKMKTAAFVFGDKCPKRGASHYYEGKCWPCPHSQKEDKRGKCCSNFNECGYCEDTSDYYCLTKPSACHNQPVCDADDSKQCVECIASTDCCGSNAGKICSNKHCCPVGQEWNGNGCVCPNGEAVCGAQCCSTGCSDTDPTKCKKECTGEGNACQKCDDSTGTWIPDPEKEGQEIQDVCHICQNGEVVLEDNEKTKITPGGCCKTTEKWLEGRCCIPSDRDPDKCSRECEGERPNPCQRCNDATGEWEAIPDGDQNGCFECIEGVPQDISDSTYPCDSECEVCNHTNGQCDPKQEGTACGDGDICRQCDGSGSCVLKNETLRYTCGTSCCADECSEKNPDVCKKECTEPRPDVCHECDDSTGEWVPIADGTIPDGMTCKWCQSGELVDRSNACGLCQKCSEDGTCVADEESNGVECGACSTCNNGVCASNGTECGTQCCTNGCDPDNPTQCRPVCNQASETDCKKCNAQTGILENVEDGTEVGCMQCVGGELQEREGSCTNCQQCNTETKICDPKPDGTECQDVCHSCKAGVCELTDPGRTHVCGKGKNAACCVYGCETRKKQKKWNLCRCPNGVGSSLLGKPTNHGLPVDDKDFVDEYENKKNNKRCDGCIIVPLDEGESANIRVPAKSTGDFTVRDENGYGASGVQYKFDNGNWKEAIGTEKIPLSNRKRTLYFRNVSKKYRGVKVHPSTTYF